VLTLYTLSLLVLTAGLEMRIPPLPDLVRPIERARARGELAPGLPRLDPDDPMANAAVLESALAEPAVRRCSASPRSFSVRLTGRTRLVRVPSPVVCELAELKLISTMQPGFGRGGLAEVAAFLIGRKLGDADMELSRVVVPPFRYTRDTVTFEDADLGSLAPGEILIGTYHTHPDDDLSEGLLSVTDLTYMRIGHIDFHGAVGWLAAPQGGLDWIFDIVDPKEGGWNVYAHDADRLELVRRSCAHPGPRGCLLDELRLAGSPYYLLVRTYEERTADAGGFAGMP
jgi:hypothetical protein